MKLLALDTSTDQMAVALHAGERVWLLDQDGGPKASASLIPAVLQGLAELGLSLRDLDGIACGVGPGAFTGLRTAVSVAQGLAYGAERPVWPLDSLAIVAEAHGMPVDADPGTPCWVAMDARLDELYAGAYHWREGAWHVAQGPGLYSLPGWQAAWADQPGPVVGNAWAAFGSRLGLPPAWVQPPSGDSRASALGRLALQVASREAPRPAAQLLPVYLRDKVAQTTTEREAARQAAMAAGRQP